MPQPQFTHGYALLIGVGADLPVTVQDATALRDVLIAPDRAAYPPEQVTLLTEATATRTQILAAFDTLIAQTQANPDATVIVYYSGHGGRIPTTQEYFLVPYGFDPSQRDRTAISGLELTQKITAITTRKLVVLLDCCHAGGIPALKNLDDTFIKSSLPPDLLDVLASGSGRVIIASSRETEYSYTGTPYSAFTACLLEALQGKAAVHPDGYARILDILIYLFNQVPQRASGPQHPFVNKVLDLGDNFPLCYYAGGNKELPDRPVPPAAHPTPLTSWRRRSLEQCQAALAGEWELRREKVKRMRTALAIEAGAAIQFQLEKQLLEEESKLSQLEIELSNIEQQLIE